MEPMTAQTSRTRRRTRSHAGCPESPHLAAIQAIGGKVFKREHVDRGGSLVTMLPHAAAAAAVSAIIASVASRAAAAVTVVAASTTSNAAATLTTLATAAHSRPCGHTALSVAAVTATRRAARDTRCLTLISTPACTCERDRQARRCNIRRPSKPPQSCCSRAQQGVAVTSLGY